MIRLLFPTALFLLAVFAVVRFAPQPTPRSAPPMGMGTPEDRAALREWNEERLRDPATGRIPENIRTKELEFARRLPQRASDRSLDWTQQGPRNRGGRTRAFGVDITNSAVLIAGSASGGIFRSADAGVNWTKTSSPLDIQNTSCLAQDRRAGRELTWYCGTGENYGVISGTSFESRLPGDGIFKSTDGGLSWNILESTVGGNPGLYNEKGSFKQVNSIAVDPVRNDSDIVVAAIFDGLVRSNDGGLTWHSVLGLDTSVTQASSYTEVRVTPTGVYYAVLSRPALYRGVFRSTDGLTWTNIGGGNFPNNNERTVIAIDPQDERRVWFFLESPGIGEFDHSLLRYTYVGGDGSGAGGMWSNRTANLPDGSCTGYFDFDFAHINTQTSYDMCIAVHPTDSNTVFIGGTNVYRSTDGWTTPGTYTWVGGYQCDVDDPKNYVWPNHHPDQHWLEFPNGNPDLLYSTNDGGVFATTDPMADSIAWTDLNDRYYTSQFYTVAIEEGAATTPYIVGGMQDNGTYMCVSSDPDQPWTTVGGGDGSYCALPEGRPFMLASTQLGKLYKGEVDDLGAVGQFSRIDPDVSGTYNFINQMVLDPATNNQLYWCVGTKLYRYTDLAAIPYTNDYYVSTDTLWEQITVVTGSGRLTALDISLAQPNTLWYGSSTGRVYKVDSLDGTPVRTLIDPPEWPNSSYISCVAPNDHDAGEWLVTFCNYGVQSVFLTTDTGATWTSVSGNLEQNPDGTGDGPAVFWALIYPTYDALGNRYFIGTSTGLYSTAELNADSTVWEQESPDLIGNVPINMITARGSDGLVVVGSHGSGVFTSNMPAAPIGISEATALTTSNAWPNPAADVVHINYYLPDASIVDVRVCDVNGRLVLRKSLGARPVGNSVFAWDVRGSAPGTYLVQLLASGVSRVERVVVR